MDVRALVSPCRWLAAPPSPKLEKEAGATPVGEWVRSRWRGRGRRDGR